MHANIQQIQLVPLLMHGNGTTIPGVCTSQFSAIADLSCFLFCHVAQVTLLSEGCMLYHGSADNMLPWFTKLGFNYDPAQHGSAPDWTLDLVSLGFSKDLEDDGNHSMMTNQQELDDSVVAFRRYLQSQHPSWFGLEHELTAVCTVSAEVTSAAAVPQVTDSSSHSSSRIAGQPEVDGTKLPAEQQYLTLVSAETSVMVAVQHVDIEVGESDQASQGEHPGNTCSTHKRSSIAHHQGAQTTWLLLSQVASEMDGAFRPSV